jgi:hypothetical protein
MRGRLKPKSWGGWNPVCARRGRFGAPIRTSKRPGSISVEAEVLGGLEPGLREGGQFGARIQESSPQGSISEAIQPNIPS